MADTVINSAGLVKIISISGTETDTINFEASEITRNSDSSVVAWFLIDDYQFNLTAFNANYPDKSIPAY